MGDPLQYKLRNTEIDMCLGEEVTAVKAGRAGRPGPARTRQTWQLLDCSNDPWWRFLHLFEARDLDEKLCKYASDTDACYRYKNANRSNIPLGLFTTLLLSKYQFSKHELLHKARCTLILLLQCRLYSEHYHL